MIYLVCGCPGQGKSTWIKKIIDPEKDIYISRDYIRFQLLGETDNYFSKEKEVLSLFKFNAEDALKRGYNIWIDATFLVPKSRKWVIELAEKYNVEIYAYAFKRSLETCLKWNSQREGRAFVPESAIRKMYEQFEIPSEKEGFDAIVLFGIGGQYENLQ